MEKMDIEEMSWRREEGMIETKDTGEQRTDVKFEYYEESSSTSVYSYSKLNPQGSTYA